MENQENNQPEEEISNVDQFQVGRSEGNAADGHAPEEDDQYTSDEIQYADGEGTALNDQLGPDDEDEDDDDDLDVDLNEDDDYNESDVEELDKDPNAYEEDDSEML
ncbi:hypothetical protein [Pedobacter endophyticus]|uniref:Uncharacterized protein n=1 Tax=Pedobacter endophyticus TaxID=2789740 RepID=A0A7S9L0J0_9SPHI|nr:hypothetical protein [Pedobacter endophyticus]QPH40183.1 hypothetical protein IZT61_02565 [Pedobacter endophyticus]